MEESKSRRRRRVVLLVVVWMVLRIVAVTLFRRRDPAALAAVRRFNRRCLNPVMLRVAGRRRWYAARLEHVGRASGRRYATPVVARPVPGGFAVPLPYGVHVDWLRNVQATGGAELQVRGEHFVLTAPRVLPTAEIAAELSPLYRLLARVYDFPGWLVVDASAMSSSVVAPQPAVSPGLVSGAGQYPRRPSCGRVVVLDRLRRRLYRGRRAGVVARGLNRVQAWLAAAGVGPDWLVTVEVTGRHSGRTIGFPAVVADYQGGRYLVSMLGEDASWVRNVRAAAGRAVIRHGSRELVTLDEVAVDRRPPILRCYLQRASGARAHIPVDHRAPIEEFEAVAGDYPVFRVLPRSGCPGDAHYCG